MNRKQNRVLKAVFRDPVPAGLAWADVESLLISVGCRAIEGAGSAVRFEREGVVVRFHRPHPGKDAKRYQIRDAPRVPDQDRSEAMSAMTFKGYSARIDYDGEDEIFFGRIAGIRDVVGFHADTVADLKTAFHEAVDDYVAACAKVGKAPEKPYSGKLMVRVDPEVHANAALAAELAGTSLAKWTEDKLRQAAEAEMQVVR